MIPTTVLRVVAKVLAHEPLTVSELDTLAKSVPLPFNHDVTVGPFFNQEGSYGEFTLVGPAESDDRMVINWTLFDEAPHGRAYLRDDRSGAWPLAYLRALAWFVIEEDVLP